MVNYDLLAMLVFVFMWAIFDRLKEYTLFYSWWEESIFIPLKKSHPKLYNWIKSDNKDKYKYITILGYKFKLHPIFWDGYHSFKNIIVLLFGIYAFVLYGWQVMVTVWFLWWITQSTFFVMFQKENK